MLQVTISDTPVATFIADKPLVAALTRYAQLIGTHPTKTHLDHQRTLDQALVQRDLPEKAFDSIRRVFLTASGEHPRAPIK